jgi:methylated-DNA-[protein]-cysteine S-methyltransferase
MRNNVWHILTDISYGCLVSYEEVGLALARTLKLRSVSARSIGVMVSRNPMSILVPCHRVIGKNLTLTGYAGALDRKKYLLEFEGFLVSSLSGRAKILKKEALYQF